MINQTIFKHAIIYTVDMADTIIPDGALVVQGDRIAAVGPNDQVSAEFPRAHVIDARDRVLLPGLINTHTHLSMTMLRSIADDIEAVKWLPVIWAVEKHLSDETVRAGAMLGIAEMIASGTTTFNDHYFRMAQVAEAVAESGIRADLAQAILENRNKRKGRRELEAGEEFAREWSGKADGRIRTRLGPHALYTCSTELVAASREAADRIGVGMHMHVAESALEMKLVGKKALGPTSVQHLEALGILGPDFVIAHGLTIDETDMRILCERSVGIAHCPQAYGKVGGYPWPAVDTWLQAGIHVGVGTDGVASNNNLDLFDEMRFATMVRKLQARDGTVLPARQMIRMATIEGAHVLGLSDQIGSLEVGKKADLIMVDFRKPHLRPLHNVPGHLVYSATGADVEAVMVDGSFLYNHRQFQTLDVEAVMTTADREFAAFLGRANWTPTVEEPKTGRVASLQLTLTQQSLKVMEVLIGRRDADDELTL